MLSVYLVNIFLIYFGINWFGVLVGTTAHTNEQRKWFKSVLITLLLKPRSNKLVFETFVHWVLMTVIFYLKFNVFRKLLKGIIKSISGEIEQIKNATALMAEWKVARTVLKNDDNLISRYWYASSLTWCDIVNKYPIPYDVANDHDNVDIIY